MPESARSDAVRSFFSGLTEFAFQCRMGVADPPLVDYLSELLVRFVRNDEVFRVRGQTGVRLEQIADMLVEAEARRGEARRNVHVHIGDFALFWSGIYPEALRKLRGGERRDSLLDYQAQGKRAYYIASTIPAEGPSPGPSVLKRLSHEFEMCVYGLGEVRREWERRRGDEDLASLLIFD
jgi:hypothetical protein